MVSIIIPTYNRAEIISETISLVLNQTYSDLEVIVVSDGPSDDTRKAVEVFTDSRMKYYEIAHSGRPAVPRNYGIRKSSGEYIAFCDDDDSWEPEKLKLQMDKFSKDRDLGLVYSQCLIESREKNDIVPRDGKQGFIFKELFLSYNFISNSTVLIKKEVFDTVEFFDEDMRFKATEDFDLWLRIAKKYKIGFVDKPLVIHGESIDSISKGVWIKVIKYYLVASKLFSEKQVGIGLFTKGLLSIFCKTVLRLGGNYRLRKY